MIIFVGMMMYNARYFSIVNLKNSYPQNALKPLTRDFVVSS